MITNPLSNYGTTASDLHQITTPIVYNYYKQFLDFHAADNKAWTRLYNNVKGYYYLSLGISFQVALE